NKTYKAYIKKRDYSGSNTDLDGGVVPIDIAYRTIGKYAGTDYWKAAECQYHCEVCCQVIGKATTIRNLLKANDG
ncbi:MAG: hypothetical protein ACPGVG_12850, partial [Mycobacterium sp.]